MIPVKKTAIHQLLAVPVVHKYSPPYKAFEQLQDFLFLKYAGELHIISTKEENSYRIFHAL